MPDGDSEKTDTKYGPSSTILDNSLETVQATEQIAKHEKFVPSAYQDSEGYWTIGYGTLIDSRRGGGITEDEARLLLWRRVNLARNHLSETYPWFFRLSTARKMALIDMCYNLGATGFDKFVKMIQALERGDYSTAADEALDSKWAHQIGQRAITIADQIYGG